jgi:hypothetical protein
MTPTETAEETLLRRRRNALADLAALAASARELGASGGDVARACGFRWESDDEPVTLPVTQST